jgi:hypothetical protein
MGRLTYDGFDTPIQVDDVELAHLTAVITTKLRRRESLALSWRHPDGTGRSTVWLHPAIEIRFEFDGPVTPELDPRRIEKLAAEAALGGITFTGADAA